MTGFTSPKGASDNALREPLNQAIATVLADGTYQAIERKYFSYDIYIRESRITAKLRAFIDFAAPRLRARLADAAI